MKKAIVKSIIFMMVAFSYQVANAQSVVTNISTNDFQSCKAYLAEHPLDTIKNKLAEPVLMVVSEDGEIAGQRIQKGDTLSVLGYAVFLSDGKVVRQRNYGKTITLKGNEQHTINTEMVEALDRKAVETRFEYNITDGRRRDVRGYQLSHAIDSPDGKVIKKAADKDGWGAQAEATYQLASGLNAFGAKGGLSYTAPWWQVDVMAGVTRTSYSANAERAGKKYNAFNSEVGLWFQPVRVDKYNQVRFWIGGGGGWEHYLTDSRETEAGFMQSEGNYIYPHVGVKLEYRFFATGNSLYFKAQWRQKKWVIQNDGNDKANALEITVGGTLGFLRDIISH
jgi:hypothetical protein